MKREVLDKILELGKTDPEAAMEMLRSQLNPTESQWFIDYLDTYHMAFCHGEHYDNPEDGITKTCDYMAEDRFTNPMEKPTHREWVNPALAFLNFVGVDPSDSIAVRTVNEHILNYASYMVDMSDQEKLILWSLLNDEKQTIERSRGDTGQLGERPDSQDVQSENKEQEKKGESL